MPGSDRRNKIPAYTDKPTTIRTMVVPEKPMLATFESMFESTPLILGRASDYWESGRVNDIREITPQLFHARIAGNDSDFYDVDIRLNHSGDGTSDDPIRVQSAACTCPYQQTMYCKHIGAMLYALRRQLLKLDSTDPADKGGNKTSVTLPHTVLEPIQQYLKTRMEHGDGHLLFMWSDHLQETARSFIVAPNTEQPLPSLTEAQDMIFESIHRYHDRILHLPTSPENDFDYREFIETIQMIVNNALQSTDYAEACARLRLCVHAVCTFITGTEDDPSLLFELLDGLTIRIRCYMENVAAYADSPTAGKALTLVMQAAHDKDLQYCDPLNGMLLVSSALAYARYADKRMWAYDAIEDELARNLKESDATDGANHDDGMADADEVHANITRMFTQMIAYDLYTLSHDEPARQRLFADGQDSQPLRMMHAAKLIHENHFQSALMATQRFLDTSNDWKGMDSDASHNGLLPDLLPHGWHTIMECCAEGLNDANLLADMYRYYIVSCNDKSDAHYVSVLRNLLQIYVGLSHDEWHEVAQGLAKDCARDITDRIKYQPEMVIMDDMHRRSNWRNPAYEKLIVDEHLSDAALIYCNTIDYPPLSLLRTIAIAHPESAKEIILDAMPIGTMGPSVFKSPRAFGTGNKLDARRSTYRQIAKQLRRFASVFGDEEMRALAHDIVARYPNRTVLREELAFAL